MTTASVLRKMGEQYQQRLQEEQQSRARQGELETMQMDLMRGEVSAMQSQAAAQQAAAKSAAPLAKKYMKMWQGSLKSTQGMYNQAMQGVSRGWEAIDKLQSQQFDFSKLTEDLETEWNNVKDKFGGLTDQAIQMAGEEMTQRRALGKQLTSLAQPDYEGAAGRAMADVTAQAEMGRQA
jgi:hypothetical protein